MQTTETGHTPGPWELTQRSERQTGETWTAVTRIHHKDVPGKHTEQDVCHITTWGADCDESRANARLIAAAPDLLAALERLQEYVTAYVDVDDLGSELLTQARAAIAKATEGITL